MLRDFPMKKLDSRHVRLEMGCLYWTYCHRKVHRNQSTKYIEILVFQATVHHKCSSQSSASLHTKSDQHRAWPVEWHWPQSHSWLIQQCLRVWGWSLQATYMIDRHTHTLRYLYINEKWYVYIYIYVWMCACVYIYMVPTYINMYVLYIYVCVCLYVCILYIYDICVYVCILCIYIYTNQICIHTCKHFV